MLFCSREFIEVELGRQWDTFIEYWPTLSFDEQSRNQQRVTRLYETRIIVLTKAYLILCSALPISTKIKVQQRSDTLTRSLKVNFYNGE